MTGEDADHDWVAGMLAADDPGPMPPDVAARISALVIRQSRSMASQERVIQEHGTASTPRSAPFPITRAPVVPPAAVPPAAVPPAAGIRRGRDQRDDDTGAIDATAAGAGSRRRIGARRVQRQEAALDRRRFLIHRVLPVAASMVVVAGASVVAATQFGSGGTGEQTALQMSEAAAPGPVPNGLVATGTAYTAAGLADQAGVLLATVAAPRPAAADADAPDAAGAAGPTESPSALANPGEAPSLAASTPEVAPSELGGGADDVSAAAVLSQTVLDNPLSAAAAYRQCAVTLDAAPGALPAAIDLAVYEGAEAAIVVLPNRAGDGYDVIVTDRYCNPDTERGSASFRTG